MNKTKSYSSASGSVYSVVDIGRVSLTRSYFPITTKSLKIIMIIFTVNHLTY